MWWDEKFYRNDEPSFSLLKLEIEIGLTPHIQLDLYQNFSLSQGQFNVEGNQFEIRYAFASEYNEISWNPVLYIEWYPRKSAQDRAEIRLLDGRGPGPRPASGRPTSTPRATSTTSRPPTPRGSTVSSGRPRRPAGR